MKDKILVAGSINMDFVIEVEKLPQKGETVHGKSIKYVPGGKGSNQAVAAKRLGAEVALLGKVGNDAFGKDLKEYLSKEQLNLKGLKTSSVQSGIASINVDVDGNNTITVVKGANWEVTSDFLEDNIDLIRNSSLVLSQFEIPQESVEKLFELAKKEGKTTMLNPSPAKKITGTIFKNTDYLLVNETELAFFSGKKTDSEKQIEKAANSLQEKGIGNVVVTLGGKGVITVTSKKTIRTEGKKVKAVDTTAAGDCFTGALASQLVKNTQLKEALDFANLAASISVQRWGASSSLPYLHEINL